MTSERILHIRNCIEQARQNEARTHSLERYLESKLPRLHHVIKLPEENQAQAMIRFLTSYIEHVPDFVEALTELTKNAGIYQHAKVFIEIAEDFFISPPEIVKDHAGLQALIDEAYLAHRLIEEVNDQITVDCGVPLAPIDMTVSNIVVHDLLGDKFANELDLAVHYAVEALFEHLKLAENIQFQEYINHQQKDNWKDILKRWPCLVGDASIELDLDHNSAEAIH